MPLLYYWRGDNYYTDLDMGAGYNLNQANPLLHKIDLGDSLWAFTRAKMGNYVLAAELVVKAKTLNPTGFKYGRYRLWGDLRKSRYFQVDDQASVEQVIRQLSCRTEAEKLGQSFQGYSAIRRISLEDHQVLSIVAKELALEPRARLLPEEKLEAIILLGDEEAVRELIAKEGVGMAESRRNYLFQQIPKRNRQLVKELQEKYQGKCQVCLWSPTVKYLEYLCQGHHIQWLSRGGIDSLDNLVLLCPNHHIAIHGCDAVLDFGEMAFDFGSHKEQLKLNYHLLA